MITFLAIFAFLHVLGISNASHSVTPGPPTAECPGGTEHVVHESTWSSPKERLLQIQNCDNVALPDNQSYPMLIETTCTEGYRPGCENMAQAFCFNEYCTFDVLLCKIVTTICYKRPICQGERKPFNCTSEETDSAWKRCTVPDCEQVLSPEGESRHIPALSYNSTDRNGQPCLYHKTEINPNKPWKSWKYYPDTCEVIVGGGCIFIADFCYETYPCDPSPCKNGATCTKNGTNYACSCASGWTGENCTNETDPCDPSPCKNGATCNKKGANYACSCASGWTGENCTNEIDEGSCTNVPGSYCCPCQRCYTGRHCRDGLSNCMPAPEPACPRFDYQEKLLDKTVRLGITVEGLTERLTNVELAHQTNVELSHQTIEALVSKVDDIEAGLTERLTNVELAHETNVELSHQTIEALVSKVDDIEAKLDALESKEEEKPDIPKKTCPSTYKHRPDLNFCWKLQKDEKLNAFEAEDRCLEDGAHLMILNTSIIVKFMQEWLKSAGVKDTHIHVGADDIAEEGSFKWRNGEPVNQIPWAAEMPNGGTNSNCLVMGVNYAFKFCDRECSAKHNFLCQIIL